MRRGNVFKKIFIIMGIILLLGIISAICYGIYYRTKYESIIATIKSTNGTELERKLGAVTAELERTKSALAESEQSVGRLEELDQRRDEGIRRISGIIDNAGKSASGIESGERRARIAFEAIAGIADILENEFSGGAKQR
jgi:hypothetical protein